MRQQDQNTPTTSALRPEVIALLSQRRPLFDVGNTPPTASQRSSRSEFSRKWLMHALYQLQMNWKIISAASAVMLIAITWYYPTFLICCLFLSYSLFLVIAAVFGTMYVHYICTTNEVPKPKRKPLTTLYEATQNSIFNPPNPIKNATNLPLIFGKTVDLQLQQIVEYVLRDFMSPWLGYVVTQPKLINDIVREDFWHAVQKMHERASRMDAAKTIAVDMVNRVTVHLEKIRIAEARAAETSSTPHFATHTYLADEEKELAFLRKLCEIMVILLLPRGYSLPPLQVLLSEILSYKIFFPLIKMLTSPDYINQKIVQNIETHLAELAISKRSFEYAASFEEVVKLINNASNLEELSLIRKRIVNDLMHATTIQNLQRAKGIDPDAEDHNLSKSEMAVATRMKRYINQLTLAKAQCEKNLVKFGWNSSYTNDMDLSLTEILSTTVGRRHLTLFLEPLKASSLVGFYMAVEEMKHTQKSSWHQLGTEIFYTYVRVPKPELQIDKHERKLIETFLLGDTGPDIFYDLQRSVLRTLEEKYYTPFVLSERYRQLREALNSDDYKNVDEFNGGSGADRSGGDGNDCISGDDGAAANSGIAVGNVAAHTSYARRKLEQIQERIDKKNQALDALKYSVKPESKVLQILEKEMEWLRSEKRQTEAHLRRTDAWTEHLGKWQATIQSVEVSDEKESLQFMILVHVNEDINISVSAPLPTTTKTSAGSTINSNSSARAISTAQRPSSISSGWVVLRSLNQVHELHRKLRHVNPNLKSLDLPTNFKLFFLKNDKHALEKAKLQIQKFLNFILEDDHLNGSEAIYTFLSPSSDHLKQSLPSPKKSKFSLSTLFKSDPVSKPSTNTSEVLSKSQDFWGMHRGDDEDLSAYLEGDTPGGDVKIVLDIDSKDSIAEPLYALMGEIFDMGGLFKWLRKSLISFVQITYGRTINRQIRESIAYLYEESMLHFYFSAILKSFWPGGVLANSYPVRSDDVKEMTTNAAKDLLRDNVPEVLCNLVGAQAAKHGIMKVFNALQNPIYNKQLFYELLEILMLEFFPEIRQLKVVEAAKKSASSTNGSSFVGATTTTSSHTNSHSFGSSNSHQLHQHHHHNNNNNHPYHHQNAYTH